VARRRLIAATRKQLLIIFIRSRSWLRARGYEVVQAPSGSLLAMHLSRVFAHYNINAVIDVGARRGEYGLWLRRNGYRGWIFSFEPVGASFAALSRRAAQDERWIVHRVALGSVSGSANINVTEKTVFSSFLEPTSYASETFGSEPTITATEAVDVRRLDEMIDELLAHVDNAGVFLKLDTQGWDLEVLRGATRALTRVAALQTEVAAQAIYEGMPSMRESLDYLQEIGFDVSGFFPVNLDGWLRAVEFDCVAVRRPSS
jgi:FkbM family methyltransferase